MTFSAGVAKRQVRLLYCLCFISLTLIGYFAWTGRQDAQQTHGALCTFRQDLVNRVEGAQTFLISHPKGFAGVPADVIRQSIKNQLATIKSLDNLSCD